MTVVSLKQATPLGFCGFNVYSMMDFRKALSACCKHWKRSFHSCCSKKILLLLLWQALFSFSNMLILSCAAYLNFTSPVFISASQFFSGIFAPLIGWFADVKIGRYETIKFGSFISFAASIFFYFAIFTGSVSTLSIILYSVSALVSLGNAAYSSIFYWGPHRRHRYRELWPRSLSWTTIQSQSYPPRHTNRSVY